MPLSSEETHDPLQDHDVRSPRALKAAALAEMADTEVKRAVPVAAEVQAQFEALRQVQSNATRRIETNYLQVVVEKLTKNVNEDHLREIFGTYGQIRDLDMPMNRQCKSLPHL
jgi:hypothetical protein